MKSDEKTESGNLPYLRQPSLSPDGSTIAFCYAGDVWIVPADGGQASRITSHASNDSHPIFSPDGTQLAFASERTGGGNIYTISLQSDRPPKRLTYHNESTPPDCWSPDGQWVYFTSDYDGIRGASYKVHIDGGTPIQIAGDPRETHYNLAISPDGKTLAFNNNGGPWWRHGQHPPGHSDIWIVSEAVGANNYHRLTQYLGKNLRPMWNADGTGLYYLSDRDGEENIWHMTLAGDAEPEQFTHFAGGRVLRPSISANGKWITFERGFQIWRLNLESGATEPVEIILQTDEKSNPIRHHSYTSGINEFELAPDGKKVAFIVHGEVFADLADKGDKIKKGGDSFKVTATPSRESQLQWHPESERVVYISDRTGHNEVFQYHFQERVEAQLTDSPEQKYTPKFSPNRKWLAYIQAPLHSDATGVKGEIWLMDTEAEEKRPFITDQAFIGVPEPTEFEWSPDSQWLAFIATDTNFFSNLYVQHIESDTPKQLTFLSNISTNSILWSPDGKFIIFNTGQYRTEVQIARVDLKPIRPVFKEDDFDRLFQVEAPRNGEEKQDKSPPPEAESSEPEESDPATEDSDESENEQDAESKKAKDKKPEKKIEPVEIGFEGIKHRLRFLTDFKLNAHAESIRPNSKTLIFRGVTTGQPNLWSMSLEEDKPGEFPKQLTGTASGKGNVHFIPNGKKFYYIDGGRIHSVGMGEDGAKEGEAKALDTRAEVEVNFHLEKIQAFDEAWRLIRDGFYDPQFHGCDWEQIHQTFRPMVQGVQTQADFRELLNLMVGELNASHLGAGGWTDNAPDSFLGADFDREALERDGHFKISEIIFDSPLTFPEESAQVGEYLVAIDGVTLNRQVNLPEQLQRKKGKRVILKLNDTPQLEGAREITVQPIDSGQHRNLRYKEWVRWNEAYVHEKSSRRLGYVHIREMSYEAYLRFIADLDTETHDREGVVIDVRFNPGGHIAPFILDVLHRRAYTQSNYRGLISTTDTNLAGNRILEQPVILITNEHSGSNAEMFSEGFQKLGLGKVVGMPTAGAVIWTWGWGLLDGTVFRLPRLRVTTLEGENTEGTARPVDVQVDRPLGEAAQGIDSQLDVAAEQLLAQIDGNGGIT